MALPNDEAGNLHYSAYIPPTGRYRGLLEDFEQGPIDISDPSEGISYQTWSIRYDDDERSPTYGDFICHAETTGQTVVVHNVPRVRQLGFAFDQNGHVFIAYLQECTAFYYWYDFTVPGFVTVQLPAGTTSVACCVDDHREGQLSQSDIILAYNRSGSLYYVQERERFDTERLLQSSIGGTRINRIGMNRLYRLQWDSGGYGGVRLSDIVGDLCAYAGLRATQIRVDDLSTTMVRGFLTAGVYSSADAIRSLQRVYFFDYPQIDKLLYSVRRGGEIIATVNQVDCVTRGEVDFETAREQGVEFPQKLHVLWQCAEHDYTSSKETSERRSRDVRALTEISIEAAVNFTPDEAAQTADMLHKVAWNEFEGKAKFTLPESFAYLVPSDLLSVEVRPGQYKRMRLIKIAFVDGTLDCETVIDRQSSYTSLVSGAVAQVPEVPSPTIPGDTTWEFMDLPALITDHDTLHYYVAGHGDAGTAWHGAQVQVQVGADWVAEGAIEYAETMGQVEETLPYASRYIPDTTNTILVSLTDAPSSTTTALIYAGKNAFLIGDEIIQVRDWVAEGLNWRGSYLLRGRLDTTPASHAIGERAVFLGNPIRIEKDVAALDTTLTLRVPSYDQLGSDAASAPYSFTGRSQTEWSPERLTAAQNGNDWVLSWVPRYRLGNSATPIPSSHFYAWRLRFTVGATTKARTTTGTLAGYTYTDAEQTADFGSAQSSFDNVEIRALNYLGGEGDPLNEAVP